MIIGNFELDFADRKIRYKAGIDVEGDRLSFALDIYQPLHPNHRKTMVQTIDW